MSYNLRAMVDDDLPMVLEWRNSEPVRRNMYTTHIISLEEHLSWFKKVKKDKTKSYFIFEEEGNPCGVIGFVDIDLRSRKSGWAFYSGNLEKRGIGSRMEYAALEHAFTDLGLHKLYCEVISFNMPVVKFHKKYGFVEEGIFCRHHFDGIAYHDVYRLALFKKDWANKRSSMAKRLGIIVP